MTDIGEPIIPAAEPGGTPGLQPLLHEAVALLQAPTQVWSDRAGDLGDAAVHGLYHSNTRLLRRARLTVDGELPEHLGLVETDAGHAVFSALLRGRGEPTADPRLRLDRHREVTAGGLGERIVLSSALDHDVSLTLALTLEADFTPIHLVKSGLAREGAAPAPLISGIDADGASTGAGAARSLGATIGWEEGPVALTVTAAGAETGIIGDGTVLLGWRVTVPAHGVLTLGWNAQARDERAAVAAASDAPGWDRAALPTPPDPRLARWLERAFTDLEALRMTRAGDPDVFLAAGAPWFFTLFGRDALWAARFLLSVDRPLALSTLRTLAALQGTHTDPQTGEQPGKIMHELRPTSLELPGEAIALPPLYYGTIDATPLWISLLRDAWRAGGARPDDAEVHALLPALRAALEWLQNDALGADGFLRYIDETGHGLANQGWKDSGDSIQWRDGTLAESPIALSEVQGYAYEAALAGAELLEGLADETGETDAAAPGRLREWASALATRFRERFWIPDEAGAYPAIALDAQGRRVDAVASNMGHLLGTGILSPEEGALIAARLVSPELDSGFGLRTLATDTAGYWPLAYHGGAVWAHDTAVAVRGLAQEGFAAEATRLAAGLVTAAEHFDYRMPELHSGDAHSAVAAPAAYPAACRPQAWSAAAAFVVATVLG
ncbi:MAG TPA: glycogen debranching N-terminal domain-containing protein [Gryllotalpicola sp.]